jgi:NAD(P)-dependent dehydrogenase (short-subunit alcohol dehydrogenase family)
MAPMPSDPVNRNADHAVDSGPPVHTVCMPAELGGGPLLEEQVVIITGASRGIGAATARAFSEAGASVALAARDQAALAALADELTADGTRAISVPTDVGDATSVERMVAETIRVFGRLDLAFNNAAGGGQAPTPLADLPVDAYDSAISITLRGVFLSMKYEIPAMLAAGGGAIVNMSSTAGTEAVGGLAGYVSAKHGVIGLTKSAALDYASQGIRVNAIAPGPILTDNLRRAGPEMQRRAGLAMPMRRIGQPDEVARAVVWLCSDQASFITGATIPIDGGKLAGVAPFSGPPEQGPN